MMNSLITAREAAEIAFPGQFMGCEAISEATIAAAEQRFIVPVVGERLYRRMLEGAYRMLRTEYLAPALALWVKLSMLPSMAVQSGEMGVVELESGVLKGAGKEKLDLLCRRTRCEAAAMLRRAVAHIEARAEEYPEYCPQENVLNRCVIGGGVVFAERRPEHGRRR